MVDLLSESDSETSYSGTSGVYGSETYETTYSDPTGVYDQEQTVDLIDIPADAVNAATGTGENLGWFGEVDRHLDYRSLTGELDPDGDEWAEPTQQTTGISGAFHATAGQIASAGEDALNLANGALEAGFTELLDNPYLLGLAGLVVIYVVGQLVDYQAGTA